MSDGNQTRNAKMCVVCGLENERNNCHALASLDTLLFKEHRYRSQTLSISKQQELRVLGKRPSSSNRPPRHRGRQDGSTQHCGEYDETNRLIGKVDFGIGRSFTSVFR
jgi:hypothetical protein